MKGKRARNEEEEGNGEMEEKGGDRRIKGRRERSEKKGTRRGETEGEK